MNVEHRGERHIDVIGAEPADGFVDGGAGHLGLGMEDELAVGKMDALGKAGRSRRIEYGGSRVLVEIGEIATVGNPLEKLLVFSGDGKPGFGFPAAVGDQDDLLDGGNLGVNGLQKGQEILVDEDDLVLGMVHRIEDLFRRQTPVLCMKDRPHHGDGEEALQVAMAVVIEDANRIARLDTQFRQAVGQPVDPLVELPVGETDPVPVDDLLVGGKKERRFEQVFDDQLVLVTFSRRVDFLCHRVLSFMVGCLLQRTSVCTLPFWMFK